MMDYLALVIEGIVTPFIILGEMIGRIGNKYWDWIISGVKEANIEKDWALSAAYWLIHIIFGAFPLLLLLLKSEIAFYCGIVFALVGVIVNISVFCFLLDDEDGILKKR